MKRFMTGFDANYKFTIQLIIFVVVLLCVNFFLAQQNEKLKVLASRPDRALELRPGTALPPLEGTDSNGMRRALAYGQDPRKTMLFVFSPRCTACQESMPGWKALIEKIDSNRFRLAAVSMQSSGVKEYIAGYGIDPIPVFTDLDPKYRVAYNLALTPQIILIDAAGKAEKVWTGVIRGEIKQDLERTFGVDLP